MKAIPQKRCEHCGGEYDGKYGSHCMANFRERAEGTVLLGQYVTRAEKAEVELATAYSERDTYQQNAAVYEAQAHEAEAEEARLSEALLSMASERDVALAEVGRLRAALAEVDGMLANSGDDFDKVPVFGVIIDALRTTSAPTKEEA